MAIRKPIKRKLAQTFPVVLTFKNPAVVSATDTTVWTQGLEAAGGAAATGETTLVTNPEILKKSFELRLFKTNEFITLLPGDIVEFSVNNATELAYFLDIPDSEFFVIVNRATYEGGFVNITGNNEVTVAGTSDITAALDPATTETNTWIWTSSNEAVATVIQKTGAAFKDVGTVTGVAAGTCVITATPSLEGYSAGTFTVTVKTAG